MGNQAQVATWGELRTLMDRYYAETIDHTEELHLLSAIKQPEEESVEEYKYRVVFKDFAVEPNMDPGMEKQLLYLGEVCIACRCKLT